MGRLCFLVILLCIASQGAYADGIRYITMRDGLSSRQVYELEEDSDGFIWMYTNSGLERYDGYRFRHYRLDGVDEKNDHLASATTMTTDANGALWVATKDGSIFSYDKTRDKFLQRIKFSDPAISIYHFDILPDNKLIIATNDGVYRSELDKEPRRLALGKQLIQCVLVDGDTVYAATRNGVSRLSLSGKNKPELLESTRGVHVKSLARSSGKLYVGPFAESVFSIDLADGSRRPLPFAIPPIPVNAMKVLSPDTLLIGVDGAGVYEIDSRDGRLLHHYRDGDNSSRELSGNTVTDILVDNEGGVWISTTHSGVNYLPPFQTTLKLITPEHGNPNSLKSRHINAVYEDSYGDIWYGTDKGVSRYSPQTGLWKHYLQNHDYSANVILAIGEDTDGNIWVGSYGDGASRIDRHTDRVTQLPVLVDGGTSGVGTRYLFTSFCDSRGHLWFGGINGLTTRYDVKNDTYHYYDEDCIAVAMNGRNGKVIFGGNKGVGVYDPVDDKVRWTTTFDSINIHYPVRSLLVDTLNTEIWIGTTGEGLVGYNYTTKKAQRFTMADGLSASVIYVLLSDKLGGTWICTENDAYRYNPKTGTIGCFTNFVYAEHKFDQVSFNPSGTMTRAGDVIIGTPEGAIIFNPLNEAKMPTSTRLIFTNLMLNDVEVTPGDSKSPMTKNIDLVDGLNLNQKYNNIAVDFAVINIKAPNRIDYEYKLEGYDTDFNKADASRRAKYSGLEPGKYKLIVRAIDLYSSAVVAERELPIVIRTPLWQTWWAKLIYTIVILVLIVLCIGYIRNRRRERRIENQIRTFSNIAHDIPTPMSMIKAPLISVEQEQGLSDEGRRSLNLARAAIEKTLDMLTAMLEIPGGKIGNEKLHIDTCDLQRFITQKCHEFAPLAVLKNLELTSDVHADLPARVPVDIDKLSHVVDNLLSNAIKYTFNGTVAIIAEPCGNKRWRLKVRDTGIGIPKAECRRIFSYRHRGSEAITQNIPGTGMGLLITRRHVGIMRGKITFTSRHGQGSEFVVTLPLRYAGVDKPVVADSPAQTQSNTPDDTKSTGRERIFIIDDDVDLRNFLNETLGSEYDVTVFDDPAVFLERTRGESPDLVIADVMMPKMRGDELCRIIKTDMSTSHIPVILLSGLTARHDVVGGLEAHADDYIVKPFDLIVLKARIKNIIENRRRLSRQVLAVDSKPEDAEYTSELDREFMVTVMDKLNEAIADSEFSVADLCAQLGMSRTSVYNKIRSITGQSVNEFIRIVRLNKAKELLTTGRYNVSEVAYMVGFSDPKYFSTCFKKQFGISPSKFGING